MKIIPAIDIKNGNCVRLLKGDFTKETIYSNKPLIFAKKWENLGFSKIHIVDLDGAKTGIMKNKKIIKKILETVKTPLRIGGGIRDEKTINELLESGAKEVIVGTRAITNTEWLMEMVKKYKEKIIVSIDEKKGFPAINGWTKNSNITVFEFINILGSFGVKRIVYTDISKDGTLSRPNFSKYNQIAKKIIVIASGGVSSIEDVKELANSGVPEVIIGKALYENKIKYEEIKKYAS